MELIFQVGNAKALSVDCPVDFIVVEEFLLNGVIFLDGDTLINFSLGSTFYAIPSMGQLIILTHELFDVVHLRRSICFFIKLGENSYSPRLFFVSFALHFDSLRCGNILSPVHNHENDSSLL